MFGKKFGRLTVIGKNPEYPRTKYHKYWLVRCSCGREKLMYESSFKTSKIDVSCGECSGIKEIKIGDIFDKLTIISDKVKIKKRWYYECKCSCGNPDTKMIRNDYLVGKLAKVKSCGKCVEFDLIGKKFGKLKVLNFNKRVGKRKIVEYKCLCDCGKIFYAKRNNLISGASTSCSCDTYKKRSEAMSIDLTGQTFGFLEVLKRNGSDEKNNAVFTVKCHNCGNIRDIAGFILRSGQKSCGCLKPEYNPQSHKTLMAKNDEKYVGKKIGITTVIKRQLTDSGNQGYLCKCDCGNEKVYSVNWISKSFKDNRNLNCGCGYKEEYLSKLKKEYVGKKYGRLTITDVIMGKRKNGDSKAFVIADCSCGEINSIGKKYSFYKIKNNLTSSCGCIFKEQKGENHPNWNPELTDEDRKANESRTGDPLYQRWRKSVIKRDKKCQACAETEELRAHHIVPWSIDKNKRYDIDNGIVLCEQCHILFHSVYGQTEHAPEDLQEFIEVM